jgi:hypothetical protein
MDRIKQDRETRKISDSFRAEILVYAIGIEQQLTTIIIDRFTKNPREIVEFIHYFEKTSFERKIELVKLILKSNYPHLLQEYEKTFVQLNQIRDIRNRLSHHHSSYDYDGKKTVFVLSPNVVKLEKNKKGLWIGTNDAKFSVTKMKGLKKMVKDCDSDIRKVVKIIMRSN